MSGFKYDCPYCKKENDRTADDWLDELTDDSEERHVRCLHCDELMIVQVRAVYTHEARKIEEEDF